MLKVGLTGNIGSGKSTIARIFEVLGVPVYHADEEAKKFLNQTDVVDKLQKHFGDSILRDGEIDRKELAEVVFNDPEALSYLNSLIHPLVKNDLHEWMKEQKHHEYIVQEAAILFESGFYKDFDKVILVSCSEELANKRVMERDGVSEEEVVKRRRNQWNEGKKKQLSDFIVKNEEDKLIIPQVLEIHKKLLKNKNGR